MKRQLLSYLGFIGLLRLLGYFFDEPGLVGFFGFFRSFGFFSLPHSARPT